MKYEIEIEKAPGILDRLKPSQLAYTEEFGWVGLQAFSRNMYTK
jgi:hypothetical protein